MTESLTMHTETECGPACNIPAPPDQVSTALVRALAEVARRYGVSTTALLGRESSKLEWDTSERTIALSDYQDLFARAVLLTGEPALGLECGLHASAASFGLMAPLVAHAPTLRDGIGLISQFHPLLVEGVRVRLTERLGVARLECELRPQHGTVSRSLVELIVAGAYRALRAFGATDEDFRAVFFQHACPSYYPAYASAFGGAERFGEAITGIEFATAALDRPHLHRQSDLHSLILTEAERRLATGHRKLTYADRVRGLLKNRPPGDLPNMAAAARDLETSVRSLRRRLDEEHTSYRALLQETLCEQACSMLRNPNLTLQAIAGRLGFADATAFHRAFKRWANVTPAEYRTSGPLSPPTTTVAAAQ